MHSGSPFYHFKTKQDILVAVMEQGLAEGLRKTEEVMALPLPPEQKLARLIRTQLGTILEEGNDFIPVLLYDWRSLSRREPPPHRRSCKDRYDALWQQVIDDLQRAGHIPGDAQLVRLLILGAVNWAGTWYRARRAALARQGRGGCGAPVPERIAMTAGPSSRLARLPIFYGWIIVAAAFVTMAIGVNARTAFSLLFPPILDEFGWDRGIVAGVFSFGFFVSALVAPVRRPADGPEGAATSSSRPASWR